MKNLFRTALLVFGMVVTGIALAQTYPTKPIRIIVGTGTGGVTDVTLRVVADELGKRLGQPVLVENRPGANTLIAATAVRNAPADGYTLYGGSVTTFSPVYMSNGFVAPREMTPVASAAFGDWFVYVPPSLNINTLADLAAYAKANPGNLRFTGPTASNNLMMALLARRMGFTYEFIPYKTTDETILAVLRGDAQVTINSAAGFGPQVQAGKLRVIATLAPQRAPLMPDVRTATEQNVPLDLRFNMGLWGPPGLSRDVVARLAGAMAEVGRTPQYAERLRNVSMVPGAAGPEELVKLYDAEMQAVTDAAQMTGLKPQ